MSFPLDFGSLLRFCVMSRGRNSNPGPTAQEVVYEVISCDVADAKNNGSLSDTGGNVALRYDTIHFNDRRQYTKMLCILVSPNREQESY